MSASSIGTSSPSPSRDSTQPDASSLSTDSSSRSTAPSSPPVSQPGTSLPHSQEAIVTVPQNAATEWFEKAIVCNAIWEAEAANNDAIRKFVEARRYDKLPDGAVMPTRFGVLSEADQDALIVKNIAATLVSLVDIIQQCPNGLHDTDNDEANTKPPEGTIGVSRIHMNTMISSCHTNFYADEMATQDDERSGRFPRCDVVTSFARGSTTPEFETNMAGFHALTTMVSQKDPSIDSMLPKGLRKLLDQIETLIDEGSYTPYPAGTGTVFTEDRPGQEPIRYKSILHKPATFKTFGLDETAHNKSVNDFLASFVSTPSSQRESSRRNNLRRRLGFADTDSGKTAIQQPNRTEPSSITESRPASTDDRSENALKDTELSATRHDSLPRTDRGQGSAWYEETKAELDRFTRAQESKEGEEEARRRVGTSCAPPTRMEQIGSRLEYHVHDWHRK